MSQKSDGSSSREEKLWGLIHAIRSQYGHGVRTCNPCNEQDCEKTAVGAGKCADCLTDDLGVLVGREPAITFQFYTAKVHGTVNEMLKLINKLDADDRQKPKQERKQNISNENMAGVVCGLKRKTKGDGTRVREPKTLTEPMSEADCAHCAGIGASGFSADLKEQYHSAKRG